MGTLKREYGENVEISKKPEEMEMALLHSLEIKDGRVITKDQDEEETLTIKLRDPDKSLITFLKALALCANPGHSFSVLMDQEGDHPKSYGFDGDGAFRIFEINGSKDFKE